MERCYEPHAKKLKFCGGPKDTSWLFDKFATAMEGK
jgi:carbamoylphosphate synthase small subunit